MTQRKRKNANKLTTNRELTDMALTLHESADYITRTMLRANINSYLRDRLSRLTQRLTKEAIGLGKDLEIPNEKAFATYESTKLIARQMGLLS
jgi:hypothetical protein